MTINLGIPGKCWVYINKYINDKKKISYLRTRWALTANWKSDLKM